MDESAVQIDRLEWITANLLNLSRLDAGLVELDLRPCAAGEIVEAVVSSLRSVAQARQIELVSAPADPRSTFAATGCASNWRCPTWWTTR